MKLRGDTAKVCPTSSKRIYRTRLKAIRHLDRIRSRRENGADRNEIAAYRCEVCGFWHLTSWEQTEEALRSGKAVA